MVARAHQTLIWERTRHELRLRIGLREYFPAALVAFDDLVGRDTLELLGKAPDPTAAARLTRARSSRRCAGAAPGMSRRRPPRSRRRCGTGADASRRRWWPRSPRSPAR